MIAIAVIAGTITSGIAFADSSSDPFAQLQLSITNLQSQLNNIQNQLNHIQLTPGPAGTAGPQGPAGKNGINGTNGAPGPQGPAGTNGINGINGTQGPAGPAGASGTGGGGTPEATPITQFLLVTGQVQGAFGGSTTDPNGKDAIGVVAVSHNIIEPTDPATGLATGKVENQPLVIVTHIDKATPFLYTALTTNENLPHVELDYYQTVSGKQTLYFKVELTNAQISSVEQINQNSADFPDIDKFGQYEQISFVYQTITWTWTDGGITSTESVLGP